MFLRVEKFSMGTNQRETFNFFNPPDQFQSVIPSDLSGIYGGSVPTPKAI